MNNSKFNLAHIEHQTIMAALRETQGNRTKAAECLGISVRTLRNKINLYREKGILDRDDNTGRVQPWFRKKRRKSLED